LHQLPLAEEAAGDGTAVDAVLRVEYLQRALVGGRVDFAKSLASKVARDAARDPFGALVAVYVLLRLGCHSEVGEVATEVVRIAPSFADAYVLRGEFEAVRGRPEASAQAFIDAVNSGIPVFGEGLTRLIEGLRASGFVHPRAAAVRHVFQRHVRGSMWSAFTPRRALEAGRPVISAGDLGFEA
ncbi:MAG TPA: hypothetical protein VFN38_02175, partial [Gemmatimonadaceae bacterium]|nr:hypothetical protein [Gemmatimonadaceae bacterium]